MQVNVQILLSCYSTFFGCLYGVFDLKLITLAKKNASNIGQHYPIKFCVKIGKSAAKTLDLLRIGNIDGSLSKTKHSKLFSESIDE